VGAQREPAARQAPAFLQLSDAAHDASVVPHTTPFSPEIAEQMPSCAHAGLDLHQALVTTHAPSSSWQRPEVLQADDARQCSSSSA
jgi:hypothetical protein